MTIMEKGKKIFGHKNMNRRHRLTSSLVVACMAVFVLLSGCCINVGGDYKNKYTRTEEHAVAIEQAKRLEVQIDVGSIKITGDDVGDCTIGAKITGRSHTEEMAREIAEGVKIEVEIVGDVLLYLFSLVVLL